MPTNDERREVAETLRRLTASEYDGEFFDCGEVEAALGLVTDDGSWYEAAGVRRLADLIEPEERTCNMERSSDYFNTEVTTWFCSECGSPIYNDVRPSYCLYCGAKVVEK